MSLERRTRLRAKSKKRAKADRGKDPIRIAVFMRDGQCLLAKGLTGAIHVCSGERFTAHHLLKQSQGGDYSESNLVTLCARGNTWVEDNPDLAWHLGLVVRAGETIEEAWAKMRKAGLTTWDPFDG